MTSQALDLTTIGHALTVLRDTYLGESEWQGMSADQQGFLDWYEDNRAEIATLDDLESLASRSAEDLNRFLADRGFDPMFESPIDIGVVSVLDMLMHWLAEGSVTTITRNRREVVPEGTNIFGQSRSSVKTVVDASWPAFRLGSDVAAVFDLPGLHGGPLVRLATKTGHHLWLITSPEPVNGIELAGWASQFSACIRYPSRLWTAGAVVPMLDMDVKPDLSWLLGLTAATDAGRYHVDQAFQQFKLRADEKGARVKVATGIAMARAACGPISQPYVFDEPFLGWFTQPGHDCLPLACFWADTDVWRTPAGSLEDL